MRKLQRLLTTATMTALALLGCSTPHSTPARPPVDSVASSERPADLDSVPAESTARSASEANRAPATTEPLNVIFVTLDGVRYREIFKGVRMPRQAEEERGTPVVPKMERLVKERGFYFGNKWDRHDSRMKISNKASLSLPGYRSLLTGEFESECTRNECGNIDRETIIDRLIEKEGLGATQVATFASWDVMAKAIESKPGRSVQSIATYDILNIPAPDRLFYEEVLARAKADRPHWGSRYDKYTFEMGLQYLKSFKPRFLYLSFVDPDEYGHEKDYAKYIGSLRDWDDRFEKIAQALESMGAYGENTSIVVTTDHGRGRGFLFKSHSKEWIDSTYVWAAVIPAKSLAGRYRRIDRSKYRQSDIRSTLEVLMGLKPHTSPAAGEPLVEIFQ